MKMTIDLCWILVLVLILKIIMVVLREKNAKLIPTLNGTMPHLKVKEHGGESLTLPVVIFLETTVKL